MENFKNSYLECPVIYLDFQRLFPDEVACLRYLEKIRRPKGFVCEKYAVAGEPFRVAIYPRKIKCWACHHLTTVVTQTPGVSALELQKRLGIIRYETAFQLLHKLRTVMVCPDREKIGMKWTLELDIIFVGGKTRSGVQGVTD